MTSATLTTYDPVLKELYPQRTVENLVYQGAPLLAMIPKSEDFVGDQLILATQYSNPSGRSSTFATAQTNAASSAMVKFVLTRKSDYAVATLDSELIEASANNKGAIVAALKREMDSALSQLGRSWHQSLYGNGGGALGKITYSASATTVTLQTLDDVANFEVGMTVASSETDGTSGAVQAGTVAITAINRSTGVLTAGAAWDASIATLDTDDFLFAAGDFGAKATGLGGWIPSAAPGTTAFFGVNRAVDTDRLGGTRFDGSALSIEEALMQGFAHLARQGKAAQADHCFMNTTDFGNLLVALGSKKQYHTEKVGDVGFDGVLLHTAAGTVRVFPDFQCPKGQAWGVKLDTLRWYGLGKSPRIIQVDGLRTLRQSAADGVEFRCVIRGNLGCTAPGYNVHITLPS